MESTLTDIRNQLDRGSFKNEEHIRVCVVIRILQELGWNIWSPDEVNLEFAVAPDEDNTKVDVAIRSGPSQLIAFIEVKALGLLRSKLSDN
jgi:predicted type IV restriction endonuclease